MMSIAVLFLLPTCNMTCTFCVTEDVIDTMTFDQALTLLKNLSSRGITNVVLGGGEPFTWPHDVLTLARRAKEMGFTVQVGTNGIRLPSGFEKLTSIDRFVLPLDSVSAPLHNRMRIYKGGHHAIVCQRLEALKRVGRGVTISTVVTRQNLHHLTEIALFLDHYQREGGKIHAWHLYRFLPQGRGGGVYAFHHGVSEEDYNREVYRVRRADFPFTIYKRKDMYRSKTVGFYFFQGGELKIRKAQEKILPSPVAAYA